MQTFNNSGFMISDMKFLDNNKNNCNGLSLTGGTQCAYGRRLSGNRRMRTL
jgi:hypothetical protein